MTIEELSSRSLFIFSFSRVLKGDLGTLVLKENLVVW